MILNEEKEGLHYLAAKKLSASVHGIASKHKGDSHCLNCLHYYRKENKLKSHDKVYKNKDFCGNVIPSEKDNISEFNQYMELTESAVKKWMDMQATQKILQK